MKIAKLTFLLLPICFSMVAAVHGQQPPSPELQRLAERIERSTERNHTDWKLERIEPITSSENIIIDQWKIGDNAIRMSMVAYPSHSEAREAIQRFARDMRAVEELNDVAEGGYWFGIDRAELAFIKGRITVYLSTALEMHSDPYITKTKDSSTRISEKRALAKEFARHVTEEMNSPQ